MEYVLRDFCTVIGKGVCCALCYRWSKFRTSGVRPALLWFLYISSSSYVPKEIQSRFATLSLRTTRSFYKSLWDLFTYLRTQIFSYKSSSREVILHKKLIQQKCPIWSKLMCQFILPIRSKMTFGQKEWRRKSGLTVKNRNPIACLETHLSGSVRHIQDNPSYCSMIFCHIQNQPSYCSIWIWAPRYRPGVHSANHVTRNSRYDLLLHSRKRKKSNLQILWSKIAHFFKDFQSYIKIIFFWFVVLENELILTK